ncbi:hypothetical protein BU17DRAFT_68582 [Hysterangium stoloniferum]|nr:hypothetical protein BU17DRAFT_68582 [Hysterangium stoloniferum]
MDKDKDSLPWVLTHIVVNVYHLHKLSFKELNAIYDYLESWLQEHYIWTNKSMQGQNNKETMWSHKEPSQNVPTPQSVISIYETEFTISPLYPYTRLSLLLDLTF